MNQWIMDNLLLVCLGGGLLLLTIVLLVMAFKSQALRNAIERERELRELKEQALLEQQTRHQAELEQWRAEHLRQLELLRSENKLQIEQMRLEQGLQLEQIRETHAQQIAQTKVDQMTIAKREAEAELKDWKNKEEKRIREESVKKSLATTVGKVTEQLVPYLPNFSFNPKDARFFGSPIDLVVFDGLDAGELQRVVMIEVKTGESQLSKRERQLRDVVRDGKVEWLELRLES